MSLDIRPLPHVYKRSVRPTNKIGPVGRPIGEPVAGSSVSSNNCCVPTAGSTDTGSQGRRARGDRVVEAQESFRAQGVEDDDAPCEYELQPVPEVGGFRLLLRPERLAPG